MSQSVAPRPDYLYPLARDVPSLEDVFAACVAVCKDHEVPTVLCAQCFEAPWQERIKVSARKAQKGEAPMPQDYVGIYFEHPNCSGGEETAKLFLPFALRDFLTGCSPDGSDQTWGPEILERLVQAGFWFWPERLKIPVRALAMRLFWDWFEKGHYAWPTPDYRADDFIGPGDDILCLCSLCQIDPYALVEALAGFHTPQADDALSGVLNFSAKACTYVAADTSSGSERYQEASKAIEAMLAAREAQSYLCFATQKWLDQAYFRHDELRPSLADELSNFSRYLSVHQTGLENAANQDLLSAWPDLPEL